MSQPNGLYEQLLTRAIRDTLEAQEESHDIALHKLDESLQPQAVAEYLTRKIAAAMKAIPGQPKEKAANRARLANRILTLLRDAAPRASLDATDDVDPALEMLWSLVAKDTQRLAQHAPVPVRPGVPLRMSELLVNGRQDLRVGSEVRKELASADRVDLLCSFLMWSGLRVIREELEAFLVRCPGGLRVITTAYMGATERRALDEIANMGAQVRVSYDTRHTRLHAKAWLFHRDTGYSTAFIGSSNLSHSAMLEGVEWNVRVSAVDNPVILSKFRATFEQYWEDATFETYDPKDPADVDRWNTTVTRQQYDAHALMTRLRVRPWPHQEEILEQLAAERERGHHHNLVVAATGTGKTVVAALDYRRLAGGKSANAPSLLFVAHRKEILEQSLTTFRIVMQDGSFGELLVGTRKPERGTHVFASVQSLHADALAELPTDAYDIVIVDEFHHAAASTYDRLLKHLQPHTLIGLTATPERTDGKSVLGWFDNRIAVELRLWKALDQGLLAPFQYFGVADPTDLSRVSWRAGRYVASELDNLVTGNHIRARRILEAVAQYIRDPSRMKALGFCVTIRHAEFMAEQFRNAGIAAKAVSARTDKYARREALHELREGNVQILFAVDLFNEGVDVPDIDTVLFLRPTESATVFLQQLGRGLRKSEGKQCLTVLDFIGNSHRKFRFDRKFRAIVGGTRKGLTRQIEEGFPFLPPGCAINLERQAQKTILESVKKALALGTKGLVEDLAALGPDVSLAEFMTASGAELEDVYASAGKCWTDLRRRANLEPAEATNTEARMRKRMCRSIHVNDLTRLNTWREWLRQSTPPTPAAADTLAGRMQLMLYAYLGHAGEPVEEMPSVFEKVWAATPIREELRQLFDVLADWSEWPTSGLLTHPPISHVPLQVHGVYTLGEIFGGFGVTVNGKIPQIREGVSWRSAIPADLFFVTIQKSESEYSPTTLYEDYPIARDVFHWESQSGTTLKSKTGQRYINHQKRGSHVMLFVRTAKKDARKITNPYLFLGPATYLRHEGERPMKITWKLQHPMPAAMFQEWKLAAG